LSKKTTFNSLSTSIEKFSDRNVFGRDGEINITDSISVFGPDRLTSTSRDRKEVRSTLGLEFARINFIVADIQVSFLGENTFTVASYSSVAVILLSSPDFRSSTIPEVNVEDNSLFIVVVSVDFKDQLGVGWGRLDIVLEVDILLSTDITIDWSVESQWERGLRNNLKAEMVVHVVQVVGKSWKNCFPSRKCSSNPVIETSVIEDLDVVITICVKSGGFKGVQVLFSSSVPRISTVFAVGLVVQSARLKGNATSSLRSINRIGGNETSSMIFTFVPGSQRHTEDWGLVTWREDISVVVGPKILKTIDNSEINKEGIVISVLNVGEQDSVVLGVTISRSLFRFSKINLVHGAWDGISIGERSTTSSEVWDRFIGNLFDDNSKGVSDWLVNILGSDCRSSDSNEEDILVAVIAGWIVVDFTLVIGWSGSSGDKSRNSSSTLINSLTARALSSSDTAIDVGGNLSVEDIGGSDSEPVFVITLREIKGVLLRIVPQEHSAVDGNAIKDSDLILQIPNDGVGVFVLYVDIRSSRSSDRKVVGSSLKVGDLKSFKSSYISDTSFGGKIFILDIEAAWQEEETAVTGVGRIFMIGISITSANLIGGASSIKFVTLVSQTSSFSKVPEELQRVFFMERIQFSLEVAQRIELSLSEGNSVVVVVEGFHGSERWFVERVWSDIFNWEGTDKGVESVLDREGRISLGLTSDGSNVVGSSFILARIQNGPTVQVLSRCRISSWAGRNGSITSGTEGFSTKIAVIEIHSSPTVVNSEKLQRKVWAEIVCGSRRSLRDLIIIFAFSIGAITVILQESLDFTISSWDSSDFDEGILKEADSEGVDSSFSSDRRNNSNPDVVSLFTTDSVITEIKNGRKNAFRSSDGS